MLLPVFHPNSYLATQVFNNALMELKSGYPVLGNIFNFSVNRLKSLLSFLAYQCVKLRVRITRFSPASDTRQNTFLLILDTRTCRLNSL